MQRRQFIQAAGAAAIVASSTGCASMGSSSRRNVVVVGAGYGGATAAKYLRLWGGDKLDVTLVEPNANFISCPLSNLVLGGSRNIDSLTVPYDALATRHGIRLVRDMAVGIDADKRVLRTAGGQSLGYDRLVLSPGVDMVYDSMPGMAGAAAQEKILHAWKAGVQTVALRRQLEAMPDGGVYVITIPMAPYRCPPGPYERACQVAWYFSRAKPRSKVLILDANEDVTSKGALFKRVWAERYKGIVEYRPQFNTTDVDAAANTAISELGDRVKADVLNVIPPQRAGAIAARAGLANMNQRWCEVDFQTFESTRAKGIHVLGDAIQVAPAMPKSGHMANQHGKVAAAAIIDSLNDRAVNPVPMLTNTCYSFVSDRDVIHVASVHRWDAAKKTLLAVPGSGGLSPAPNQAEMAYALGWASNIWADSLM
jgi:sulfide dehydrogenase [flavocytochrome c] flavoprotein subunit